VSGVVMLAIDSPSTWMVFDALDRAIGVDHVVVEEQVSGRALLAARARRLGWRTAAGQALFRLLIQPLVEWASRRRTREIASGIGSSRPGPDRVTHVPSVNDRRTAETLRRLDPRVVVVAGTRIIKDEILGAVEAPFINMHAGMTPRYRGVHGGYWALAQGDHEHCGVTVHLVDPGVDTGAVIAQARIQPGPRDSFATYPLLQLSAGLPLLVEAVRSALEGSLEPVEVDGPSRQWYHPTAWGYVLTRLRRGVR
jgi:folate-dependent phosphoribosylglycinamide formyltransferase PurN